MPVSIEKLTSEKDIEKTRWYAVSSFGVLSFVLVGLEFMPVSLLTPIAQYFAISEGQAGQSIVVSAFFAIMASLFGNRVLSIVNRRFIILLYSFLLILSSLIVGLSTHFYIFLIGRVLVGLAVGGFWSLSVAVIARLATKKDVPRAIAILQLGPAAALVLAAPIGSYLETIIGWQWTFLATIPLGLLLFVWQFFVIPSLPPQKSLLMVDMFLLLKKNYFATGMIAVCLFFIGQNSIYIYLRPFLETITNLYDNAISITLLGIGLGGCLGLLMIGKIIRFCLTIPLIGISLCLAIIGLLLIMFGHMANITILLLIVWGILASPFMVAWSTWMTIVIPKDLEAGGGLQVALIQASIAGGATFGGFLLDYIGWWSGFVAGVLLLGLSALCGAVTVRLSPR